jgi:hypothetical protein
MVMMFDKDYKKTGDPLTDRNNRDMQSLIERHIYVDGSEIAGVDKSNPRVEIELMGAGA